MNRIISVNIAALVFSICILQAGGAAVAADLIIYGDAVTVGWADWSWNTTSNFSAQSPVHAGTHSIAVTYSSAWAGFSLHSNSGIDLSNYDQISFWIHGGAAGNQHLRFVVNGDDGSAVAVIPQAGLWTHVTISLSSLGSPASLSDLNWQDNAGALQPLFYLDDITLIERNGVDPSPLQGPALSIDINAGRKSISEDIYGLNYAEEQLAAELHLPVRRWGGNSTTRYNWQTSMYNTGSDWYFENIPDGSAVINGSASDRFVDQDRRTGSKTIMTVPLIGWTPKSNSPRAHPYNCGFKVSKYGSQSSVDSWDQDCGSGVKTDWTTLVTGNDSTDTSAAIGPDFVVGWINHLIGKYGTAANGGIAYYNLDNEPMLWNSTHRDVHPQPTTYDEMRNSTYQYASAIKTVDSSAKTLGPVLWGWCAYFWSARDGCGNNGTDYQTHGNMYFVPWYLQQMKAYEQANGVRILDYLDLHNYPQGDGIYSTGAGNAATQALRLRSTRQLWDQNYQDESWINDKIRLIPRMKDWVTANYPGTKTAITEYNWGGLAYMNGALAQADVLGIFGREGLDLATLWGPPTSAQPGAYAYRIYRNYDGSGGRFGDIGVNATSSDQGVLSVYASQRSTDNAVTAVIINKTANGLSSSINLAGFSPQQTAAIYQYGTANFKGIVRLADQQITGNSFTRTFSANSITLLVMWPAGGCSQKDVRIKETLTQYQTIQEAYAASSDNDTLQLHVVDFSADLYFDNAPTVNLLGGYVCDYSAHAGFTTIYGTITIKGGTVVVDSIVLR